MIMKVHYEDNLFFLSTLVKALKTGLAQDIDPEFFIDKVIEDIFFIDSSLAKTFNTLKSSTHLIKRKEYLRVLFRTKKVFIEFLEEIVGGKLAFSPNLEPFFPKLKNSLNEHIKDNEEIHLLLEDGSDLAEAVEDDVISRTEYQFLLEEEEETAQDKQE